jgi:hypothetical protein
MYTLAVAAIFKNESHCISEWIQHYIFHGAEHIYLINDASTDDFLPHIQQYIDSGFITLFNAIEPYYLGRQRNLYNQYILPRLEETQWMLLIDLDEFVWSTLDIDLRNILRMCENLGQVQFRERLFGSNGHTCQPKRLVESFTWRAEKDDNRKYFVHSTHKFSSLNIHHADFINEEDVRDVTKCMFIDPDFFVYNHYKCQSREFWDTVKCTRGDCDDFLRRRLHDFAAFDLNEVEDRGLYMQNIHLSTS